MKNIVFGVAVLLSAAAAPAFAQTAGNTPAIATPDRQNPTAPVPGKNSFTEDQDANGCRRRATRTSRS